MAYFQILGQRDSDNILSQLGRTEATQLLFALRTENWNPFRTSMNQMFAAKRGPQWQKDKFENRESKDESQQSKERRTMIATQRDHDDEMQLGPLWTAQILLTRKQTAATLGQIAEARINGLRERRPDFRNYDKRLRMAKYKFKSLHHLRSENRMSLRIMEENKIGPESDT